MKNDDVLTLNEEQRKAVEYDSGPLLIVAGAGTGKTLVITEKIKRLIADEKAKPEEILALTFTEKASAEMEERVDKSLPYGYFQLWISTFHSFCDQILHEEISNIGLDPNYKLITQAESIIFFRKNLHVFNLDFFRPLGNPHKFIDSILIHFSRLKDENISPQEYLTWVKKLPKKTDAEERKKYLELASAYAKYEEIKIKQSLLDFSDLIYLTIHLFKKRPALLKKYQERFKYVFIDEFQDTNIAQYELIKLMCPPKSNPKLTVVGDDSQAIYKFRGASVSNILGFMKDYKNARLITLLKNYRSNQDILDSAYRLIKHNDPDTLEAQLGISKKLVSNYELRIKDNGKNTRNSKFILHNSDQLNFYLGDRVEDEASHITSEIKKLSKTYKFSDFAILARANNHLDPFIRALVQKGIPFQLLGPGRLFREPEVKDLIAYLNFLSDPEDSISLYRTITMDIFDIDRRDIAYLIAFGRKINRSVFRAMEIILDEVGENNKIYKKYIPELKDETLKKLGAIYKMILRHLKASKKETAGQILYFFLEDTGYLKLLATYKSSKEEKTALNISKFFDKLRRYELEHDDASLHAVVDYLKMSMELGESPLSSETDISSYNAVNLLTVHSSKGLEFPIVFMVNLSQGRFPTYERREKIPLPDELIKEKLPQGDYHMLEERRLFYVGMTRSQDRIYLTGSKTYAEGKRIRKISNFAVEAFGQDKISSTLSLNTEQKHQLSIFEFKKPEEAKVEKLRTEIDTFSYTQLETYKLCPLRYKYQYVIRLPSAAGEAASLGTSIHDALQGFYTEFIKNRKIGLADLRDKYEESWIPVGYTSADSEARNKKEGWKYLENYFSSFHDSKLQILGLEQPFKIRIDKGNFISGKIDRIDKVSASSIEIIDYKTGKKPEEKELKKNLQLTIYLLAASDKGLYNRPIQNITLTFYYLKHGEKVSLQKTNEEILEAKKEILETMARIRGSSFEPNVGPHCDFCPFRMVCEAWQ